MMKAILCGSFYELLQKASERKTSQTMPSCSSSVHYSTVACCLTMNVDNDYLCTGMQSDN